MRMKSVDRVFTEKRAVFETVSSFIHQNPELAFEERKSHDFLCSKLKEEGFEVTPRYLGCETAFLATYGSSKGVSVCIMCEYDALPEVGHACGHNLIAEAGFAAGVAVKAFLEDNPAIEGKVLVLGTPAEESGGGKQVLLDKGAFDDVDVAMMVHPANTQNETNPFFIGVESILVEYEGKAAHAAGSPWEGKNALDGVVTCYNGLAMLRQHLRPNCKVHAVIKNGGAAANVVPAYASLSVFFRAPTVGELDSLRVRVADCAQAGARLSDTTVKITTTSARYLPLRSDPILAQLYKKYCEEQGMVFENVGEQNRFVASSDVGNVSWKVPTIQPVFHIDAEGPNHSTDFTEAAGSPSAQSNTLISARAMALVCIDLLLEPNKVEEIRSAFKQDLKVLY